MWDTGEAARQWPQGAAWRDQVFGAATRRGRTIRVSWRVGSSGRTAPSWRPTSRPACWRSLRSRHARGLTNTETLAVDAQQLDVPDGSFDAAISRFGLMFMPDPHGTLVRIGRALHPGDGSRRWSVRRRSGTRSSCCCSRRRRRPCGPPIARQGSGGHRPVRPCEAAPPLVPSDASRYWCAPPHGRARARPRAWSARYRWRGLARAASGRVRSPDPQRISAMRMAGRNGSWSSTVADSGW